MKRIIVMLVGILLISSFGLTDEVSKVGTTAAGFLNIDVGAQAVSMGGAYVSIAEDATAMYWNPSGIARANQLEALFQHTKWIADVSVNYLGLVIPVRNIGSFGVNINSLTMDDMERTTVDRPDGTGEMFSAGSSALGICFARNLTDRFSIGFNVKYITEKIYDNSAHGVAFDVGTLFDTPFSGLKIGMSITNYGPKMRMKGQDLLTQVDIDPKIAGNNENINADLRTDAFDLPLMFRVGVSMDVLKGLANSNLILAVDALHPNNSVESLNIGIEYTLNNMIFFRLGHSNLGRYNDEKRILLPDGYEKIKIDKKFGVAEGYEGGLSLGGGIKYNLGSSSMVFDYAFKDFGILNNVQIFTLGLKF
ncbi:PorV/PorQ family protein [bacterium]|nr:PorV/PorQ family protein [bacterium]